MAKNIFRTDFPVKASLAVTGLSSGDVGVLAGTGKLPYVAMEDTGDSISGQTTLALCNIVMTIKDTVTAEDNAGDSAVALGDKLYKDGTEINKDSTNGSFVGYALGTLSAGAEGEIEVALAAPGS